MSDRESYGYPPAPADVDQPNGGNNHASSPYDERAPSAASDESGSNHKNVLDVMWDSKRGQDRPRSHDRDLREDDNIQDRAYRPSDDPTRGRELRTKKNFDPYSSRDFFANDSSSDQRRAPESHSSERSRDFSSNVPNRYDQHEYHESRRGASYEQRIDPQQSRRSQFDQRDDYSHGQERRYQSKEQRPYQQDYARRPTYDTKGYDSRDNGYASRQPASNDYGRYDRQEQFHSPEENRSRTYEQGRSYSRPSESFESGRRGFNEEREYPRQGNSYSARGGRSHNSRDYGVPRDSNDYSRRDDRFFSRNETQGYSEKTPYDKGRYEYSGNAGASHSRRSSNAAEFGRDRRYSNLETAGRRSSFGAHADGGPRVYGESARPPREELYGGGARSRSASPAGGRSGYAESRERHDYGDSSSRRGDFNPVRRKERGPLLDKYNNVACFCCGSFDHLLSECPQAHQTCFICRERGHVNSACPQNREVRRCYCCGDPTHNQVKCRFKSEICEVCNKAGHIGRACPEVDGLRRLDENSRGARRVVDLPVKDSQVDYDRRSNEDYPRGRAV